MKRQRFKYYSGDLGKKLAQRHAIASKSLDFIQDSVDLPKIKLSTKDFTDKEKIDVHQASYISKAGISYRVSTLRTCFRTSHKLDQKLFSTRMSMVMINGLTRTKDHWVYFDRLLARDLNIITIDPRGVGESRQKASWNLSVDQMSDDVKEVLDDLDIKKAFILGFSLGGMTALMFGLRYPRRTYSLIVINSSIGGGARFPRLYPNSVFGLAKGISKGGINFHRSLSEFVLSKKAPNELHSWAADLWANLEKKYGKGIMITFKQLVAASRFRNPHKLLAIKCPCLVLFGENDNFVASSHSAYIFSHLFQAILFGIKGGGHELHFDKPFELRDSVLEFLQYDFSKFPKSQ